MLLTVSSFLIVTALVAYISWLRTKNDDLTTSKGYFLAGRGLSGIVIGCSMVLTSLSTEQLIGVNAVSYQNNFSIIAWTVPTVIPLCFLALYMLPKYLRNGYTTIPEFFENRFDRQTRLIMSGLFLVFYLLIVIPTALYTGAIAFNKIFNLETYLWIKLRSSNCLYGDCYWCCWCGLCDFWWLKSGGRFRYYQCRNLSDWCIACACICIALFR